jgi:hypothetical protein
MSIKFFETPDIHFVTPKGLALINRCCFIIRSEGDNCLSSAADGTVS